MTVDIKSIVKAKSKAKAKAKAAPKVEAKKSTPVVDSYLGKISKEMRDGEEVEMHKFDHIKLYRKNFVGKQHGVPTAFQKDFYVATKFKLDRTGKVILRDSQDPTSVELEIIVESDVDDNFKLMHKDIYNAYIKKIGHCSDNRYSL
jgi:hypothetical protein